MQVKESSKIWGKIIEAIIGLFLLIPPILGVIFFVISVFGGEGKVPELRELSSDWTGSYGNSGGYTSAAPIYLGLMAIAGAYLIKDSLQYLFWEE